jgi:tetratricopeptide (TPR) repeat protein
MKATSIKAVLLAASLIFPTWRLAQTKSKDAAAYTSRGIAKLQKDDWDGAIADFNRALRFDPKLAQAYDNRGLAKTEKGDLEGAITDFNRVLQLNPKNGIAYNNRGNAKAHKGDFDGAIADFNRALQLNPKLAKAYYNRGNAKREKYDLLVSGAVDEFPFPDYDLGTRKAEKRYLNAAVADFNRALQLNPKLAKAYDNRGLAKFSRGDLDGAMTDFNSALQLDPKLAPAYERTSTAARLKHIKVTRTVPLPTSTARCSSTRTSPQHTLAAAVRIFWLTTGRQRCMTTGVFASCRNEIRNIPVCSSGLFGRA